MNGLPDNVDTLRAGSLGSHPNGKNVRDVWHLASERYFGSHVAPFPTELARRAIKAGCPVEGVVLDPFAGSGTTGQVAEELGRNSILFDIDPRTKELMQKRIDSARH